MGAITKHRFYHSDGEHLAAIFEGCPDNCYILTRSEKPTQLHKTAAHEIFTLRLYKGLENTIDHIIGVFMDKVQTNQEVCRFLDRKISRTYFTDIDALIRKFYSWYLGIPSSMVNDPAFHLSYSLPEKRVKTSNPGLYFWRLSSVDKRGDKPEGTRFYALFCKIFTRNDAQEMVPVVASYLFQAFQVEGHTYYRKCNLEKDRIVECDSVYNSTIHIVYEFVYNSIKKIKPLPINRIEY